MLDRPIIGIAVWLSKPLGFLATCFTVALGISAGALLSFNDHWALVFNLFLSIAAMLLAGIILVAGSRDTVAIQMKLDGLIRAVENADDLLVGIEERSAEELELLRHEKTLPSAVGVPLGEDHQALVGVEVGADEEPDWTGRIGKPPSWRPTMSFSELSRLIYASPNGDHWHLLFDPTTKHSFVRHTGNAPSGGHVTDLSLATFLASDHNGPEHQELWRLIGMLVGIEAATTEPISLA